MKVAIAAGGRFHSLHLAHQLEKHAALAKLYTGAYASKDVSYVSESLASLCSWYRAMDEWYFRLRLRSVLPKSYWYVVKDNLFDDWLRRQLKDQGRLDIFVSWTHYFFKSLPRIKATGAKIIAESGSCHILEQQKLLNEEYERWGIQNISIHQKNIEKTLKEYDAADYIMTSSAFVRKSFLSQGFTQDRILKIPYGVNYHQFFIKRDAPKKKFRVIFVGQLGVRKGLPYLLDAWANLDFVPNHAELLLVGPKDATADQVLSTYDVSSTVKIVGAVSQQKLKELYECSSVFVLPSIEEGLAMVQAEAMASGLPIICTTNTGGEELITNSKEGFIVPIRDSDALAEKLMWCYERRDECFELGQHAQKRAQHFTWDDYGEKILEAYRKVLS